MFSWYQDESLWPASIDQELFDNWFELEYHSMIIDILVESIEKEEM